MATLTHSDKLIARLRERIKIGRTKEILLLEQIIQMKEELNAYRQTYGTSNSESQTTSQESNHL